MIDALRKLFLKPRQQDGMMPLYHATVAAARAPHWYEAGQVPDTIDGRFDMLAAMMALVLIRLEDDAGEAQNSVWLTELFIEDMDGQLREAGIGDFVVGKHIGKLMSALGGRLDAVRAAAADGADFSGLVERNILDSEDRDAAAVAHVSAELARLWAVLKATPTAAIVAGDVAW